MVSDRQALLAALRWHVDAGADDAWAETPGIAPAPSPVEELREEINLPHSPIVPVGPVDAPPITLLTSHSAAQDEANRLAAAAMTLDDLRTAIEKFEHIALKGTAKSLVFADGNPAAPVMLIGEAPGADEDIQGKPFVGASGQLLDRILRLIDLNRKSDDPAKSIYISNILNWRPPGNRTPTPAEIALSLPFILRHIALIKPKVLILAGGTPAKALLDTDVGITRLRGRWHEVRPTPDAPPIPALATYHPSYLLRTPSQKRAVWLDMLAIQQKLSTSPATTKQ